MTVTRDFQELSPQPRVAAIGSFDGVHRGHQAVIRAMRNGSLRRTAITFDPHPRVFFGKRVGLLSGVQRRVELLQAAGADDVLIVPFTRELATLSPQEWIDRTLLAIGVRRVVVGADFRFGRDRRGDVGTLVASGLETDAVELLPGISSSRIRGLVQAGSLPAAAQLLGRPTEVEFQEVDRSIDLDGGVGVGLLLDSETYAVPPDGWYRAELGGVPCLVSVARDREAPHRVRATLRSVVAIDPTRAGSWIVLKERHADDSGDARSLAA